MVVAIESHPPNSQWTTAAEMGIPGKRDDGKRRIRHGRADASMCHATKCPHTTGHELRGRRPAGAGHAFPPFRGGEQGNARATAVPQYRTTGFLRGHSLWGPSRRPRHRRCPSRRHSGRQSLSGRRPWERCHQVRWRWCARASLRTPARALKAHRAKGRYRLVIQECTAREHSMRPVVEKNTVDDNLNDLATDQELSLIPFF